MKFKINPENRCLQKTKTSKTRCKMFFEIRKKNIKKLNPLLAQLINVCRSNTTKKHHALMPPLKMTINCKKNIN